MVYFKLMNIFLISADNESTEIRKLNGRFFLERRISLIKLLKVLIYSGLVCFKSRKDWSRLSPWLGLNFQHSGSLHLKSDKPLSSNHLPTLNFQSINIFFCKKLFSVYDAPLSNPDALIT